MPYKITLEDIFQYLGQPSKFLVSEAVAALVSEGAEPTEELVVAKLAVLGISQEEAEDRIMQALLSGNVKKTADGILAIFPAVYQRMQEKHAYATGDPAYRPALERLSDNVAAWKSTQEDGVPEEGIAIDQALRSFRLENGRLPDVDELAKQLARHWTYEDEGEPGRRAHAALIYGRLTVVVTSATVDQGPVLDWLEQREKHDLVPYGDETTATFPEGPQRPI